MTTSSNRLFATLVAALSTFALGEPCSGTIQGGGSLVDSHHSFVYYEGTGEFAFEGGGSGFWTDLSLSSDSGIFVFHENATPTITTHSVTDLIRPFGGGNIAALSLGLVAQPGLTEPFLLSDLTGFAGCGPACDPISPDFVYIRAVPEPTPIALMATAIFGTALSHRRHPRGTTV